MYAGTLPDFSQLLSLQRAVNIFTVKSTGFTCLPFSSVVSLYFWQSRTVKSAKLVFTTSQNYVKRADKVQGKKDAGKTCTSTVDICSVLINQSNLLLTRVQLSLATQLRN